MEAPGAKKKARLEPNEPGSDRGFGLMILDEPPTDAEVMDDDGTQKLQEAAADLRELAGRVRSDAVEARRTSLAAIEALLAASDVLTEDCIKHLEETQERLQDELVERAVQPEPQDADTEAEDEPLRDEKYWEQVSITATKVLDTLSHWQPFYQQDVLRAVTDRLPELEREQQLEDAKRKAMERLVDAISESDSDTLFINALATKVRERQEGRKASA